MVEKSIILTWHKQAEEGIMGGVQSQFDLLAETLGTREVSWMDAQKVLGLWMPAQYARYSIIDRAIVFARYLKQYEEIFGADYVISDDCCACFADIKNLITIAQNPYFDIAEKSYPVDSPASFEFGVFYTMLQEMQFKKSKKIVSVSNYMQDYCKKMGFESKVILNGVDTEKFSELDIDKETLKDKYKIPKDKKIGLWVGSFHPLKWTFMPELIKHFKDVFWILCFKHDIQKKPKLRNVKMLKSIPHDEMSEIYNLADFYISTSPVESCGLAALEAMSCNIPIIVFKTGYFWDANTKWDVGPTDYGLIVSKWTSDKYKEAVEKMLSGHYTWEPRAHINDNDLDLDSWILRWKNFIEEFKQH